MNERKTFSWFFSCIPASFHLHHSGLVYGLCSFHISSRKCSWSVRLFSCFLPSCLPMCCNRTLCPGSFSIVSLTNCQLCLCSLSLRLTFYESLPVCFLCVLQSASVNLFGFMLLFSFLLFVWVLSSHFSFTFVKAIFCFHNPSLPWFQVLNKLVSPKRFCLWGCTSFCSRAFTAVLVFPFHVFLLFPLSSLTDVLKTAMLVNTDWAAQRIGAAA